MRMSPVRLVIEVARDMKIVGHAILEFRAREIAVERMKRLLRAPVEGLLNFLLVLGVDVRGVNGEERLVVRPYGGNEAEQNPERRPPNSHCPHTRTSAENDNHSQQDAHHGG